MKYIDIEIHPDGTVKMEVIGAVGKQCEQLTAPFEKALGGELVKRTLKPEATQTVAQTQQIEAKNA